MLRSRFRGGDAWLSALEYKNICAASRRDVSGTRRTRSEDVPLGVARCRLPIPDHFGGSLEVGRGLKSGQGGFSDGRRLAVGYGGNGPQ